MSKSKDIDKLKQEIAKGERKPARNQLMKRKQKMRKQIALGELALRAGLDRYDNAEVLERLEKVSLQLETEYSF